MRKLEIDFADLESAFETSFPETSHYFDTETGEVLGVADDTRRELERLLEDAEPDARLEDLLRESSLPDWQKQAVAEANRVEAHFGGRIVAVPEPDAREDFRDMEDFCGTVTDPGVRAALEQALSGRGAFRRFRDAVHGSLRLRDRWFEFKRERLREHITRWLASLNIEPVWKMPFCPAQPPEPLPRTHLLQGVLNFVQAAARLQGVQRIALFGSLATEEPRPDDADVLVTVTDDMDLAPLARFARKLNGHAMQRNRGGDVFLADPRGVYLGRTCPWKECGPGLRQSCDALHCGRRHYLHDDWRAIRLDAALVQAPPIELWPTVLARVTVPADVEQLLLGPLRASR